MIPWKNVDVYHLVASHLSSTISKEVNDHDYAHFLFFFLLHAHMFYSFLNKSVRPMNRMYIYVYMSRCKRKYMDVYVRKKKKAKKTTDTRQ